MIPLYNPILLIDIIKFAQNLNLDICFSKFIPKQFDKIKSIDEPDSNAITFCNSILKIPPTLSNSLIFANKDIKSSCLPEGNFIFTKDSKSTLALFIERFCPPSKEVWRNFANNINISSNCYFGNNITFHPNVSIYQNTVMKNNITINSGVVVGSSGLGLVGEGSSMRNFPDLGGVLIGSNVSIGSNSVIAKSPFGNTIIGNNTKIGNLVNIGHNAVIDNNVIITSGCILARCHIKKNTFIGIGTIIKPGVSIGSNCQIGMHSTITKDIPDNSFGYGSPFKIIKQGR